MTKYILHGGNTSAENDANRDFFQEMAGSAGDKARILLCFFAPSEFSQRTEEEKYRGVCQKFAHWVPDNSLDLVFAQRDKFIEQLERADGLYLHGGETDRLYAELRKYPEFKALVREKKVVAGSSAGAYVLCRLSIDYADKSEAKQRFGFLPVAIACHIKGPEKEILDRKFDLADPDKKFIREYIPDCEMRIYHK